MKTFLKTAGDIVLLAVAKGIAGWATSQLGFSAQTPDWIITVVYLAFRYQPPTKHS